MRSYYGNLLVDIFECIFALVSLLLVWFSCVKDSAILFGITAIIYMLPRLLSIILGIANNGRDLFRLIFDVISLLALAISFVLVCFVMFDSQVPFFGNGITKDDIFSLFYILSSVSMLDMFYKIFVGICQKFSMIIRNLNQSYARR